MTEIWLSNVDEETYIISVKGDDKDKADVMSWFRRGGSVNGKPERFEWKRLKSVTG